MRQSIRSRTPRTGTANSRNTTTRRSARRSTAGSPTLHVSGSKSIATGAVILRRRSAEPELGARRRNALVGSAISPCESDHILRVFAAQDHLSGPRGCRNSARGCSDDRFGAFGGAHVRLRAGRSSLRDGAWVVDAIVLDARGGTRLSSPASTRGHRRRLLAGLDGRRTLGEALDELARGAGAVGGGRDQLERPLFRSSVRSTSPAGFSSSGSG